MKRFALYIIILYIGVLLTGCRDSTVTPEQPPQPRAEAERTVIVYMVADNSLASVVKDDTLEMVKGKNFIPENVNFIIYLDDKQHMPAIYELSAKNGMKRWKQYDEELCSTDGGVMQGVVSLIEQYFPARHYGIALWSHATGWAPRRKTFGKDETPGSTTSGEYEMEIPALREVLSHFPKFEYLFFDACFMQCIEAAYELRSVANFMVGSPAEIPGPGAPYHLIIDALCRGDAKGIVEGYDSGYPGKYNGYYYSGVLLSCIDMSKLEALAKATGKLITPFYMERKEPPTTGFQPYSDYLSKYTYYFDMRTTMCRLLPAEQYAEWMEVFDEAVPLHTLSSSHTWYAKFCNTPVVFDPECYSGVSMFVPMDKYEYYGWNRDFQKTSWYEAAGWSATGW